MTLKTIYLERYTQKKNQSLLDKAVKQFIETEVFDDQQLLQYKFKSVLNPIEIIERKRELLVLSLLSSNILSDTRTVLQKHVVSIKKEPLWEECQLSESLQSLLHLYNELEYVKQNFWQTDTGAVPFEWGGHWSWGRIPLLQFHSELGVLWFLLGNETNDQEYINAAVKLTEWHLNTMDYDCYPFTGLFIQESDVSLTTILANNYLLFLACGVLSNNSQMLEVADKQLDYLKKIENGYIHPLAVLLEKQFLDTSPRISEKCGLERSTFKIDDAIYDANLGLVGYRSSDLNVVSTMYGGGTGMGCFYAKDVQVVNFGPQHLPLNDCQGFGIEGAGKFPNVSIHMKDSTYHIQSQPHIAPKKRNYETTEGYRNGKLSCHWIHAFQKFHNNELEIGTKLKGLLPIDSLAFSFFVKSNYCRVGNEYKIHPRSLERYQGEPKKIVLHGEFSNVALIPQTAAKEMEVIPLAGGDNFWGADFLIAFHPFSEGNFFIRNSPHLSQDL